ncbi:GMC oxidoreductase [Sinorhizobium meliloti]|uniref:GMC oxidoreductase n=1 Tax=Rhizobium meliloti TaxID=382 RepID=UPI000D1F6376|nr:GMC family oxidoreductase [Sinorhizobium meliloti]MDW9418198.1 GMC family oxidoreductase [Sinorhizobium meliloti]MDW9483739.1 GMC family oxidoreductase [Sinorhizobium meliloti]MDW9513072.1 GMC family oxidoreductase [Sinorhizobium meliloti]MDW9638034.1 GMC family oxidoreductase [Sinorhizobium meliloti]MDW9668941.1 GMC family oxidoreductase [Sinorhizobium meliloti]
MRKTMESQPDIVIIGSGVGGATVAAGLAASGAEILILEAGSHIEDLPVNRDQRAIFQRGHFRPKETWYEAGGPGFNPGNYYNVGGNSKFYGAVLTRYRREDFEEMQHRDGVSPAWPFSYEELEPWYSRAEQLYQVRGKLGEDPTEPAHSSGYPHGPVPDEPAIAMVRERLTEIGLHPYSLPLGVDIERWLAKGKTPWDAHPNSSDGKMDAETAALAAALKFPNVRLQTGSRVTRLVTGPDGKAIETVLYARDGTEHSLSPKLVILCAGAVQSAVLLLRSADDRNPTGLANRSDQVGRNFMNHNSSAVIALSPWYRNDSVYQKTFGLNDFYLSDGAGGPPLGNVQLLGRISGAILKANMPAMPEWLLNRVSARGIDFYAMSEDLPSPESRVMVDGERVVLKWVRTNWQAHLDLVARLKAVLKKAGFPIVLARAFDKRTPSHQCGTVRIGNDPGQAPLDVYCRAFDHPNLFVVDAGFLPTSAAVNPALTVAAQALRVADHIVKQDLRP